MSEKREQLSSRIGFILLAAGCAIGLGNIWRFPYIVGENGGGFFVLLYLICLALLGFPILLLELSVGRAGRSTFPGAFKNLKNKNSKFRWEIPVYVLFAGNMILLMFYTVLTGWLLAYMMSFLMGDHSVMDESYFSNLLSSPNLQIYYLLIALILTVVICIGGVQKRIEKVIKYMMGGLFILLLVLVVKANLLEGASNGLKFFLMPNWGNFVKNNPWSTIYDAMTQAFFTLSIGIGSIAICGSYTSKERTLVSEGSWIIALDTMVAFCAGLIIFPACFAFGVKPEAGPSLIFITLPKVFMNMSGGFFWGSLFFLFLFVAALSTLVAVFENIVAFGIDELKWSRKKSTGIFSIALAILSLPCIFGFNLWKNFHPFGGDSTVLDLEDFIVSMNLLPLGALYVCIFCLSRYGWGKDNCLAEINEGKGLRLSRKLFTSATFFLPVIIFGIWLIGIINKFFGAA